jgi:hypothetical protein
MELKLVNPDASKMSTVLGISDEREAEFEKIVMREFDEEREKELQCSGAILSRVLKHAVTRNEELFCSYVVGAKFVADKISNMHLLGTLDSITDKKN